MKKWCKLSLTSLIIPTAGSIALVAVGCGSSYTDVYLPVVNSDINLIGGDQDNPATWWTNTFTTPEARINAFNKYLAPGTQLYTTETKDVTASGTSTQIQFTVSLNPNYKFSGIQTFTWVSNPIEYQGPISKTLFKPIANVYAKNPNLGAWQTEIIGTDGTDATKTANYQKLVTDLFVGYPNLNTIEKVTLTDASQKQQVNATVAQNFTATIQLKQGFVFDDKTTEYTTPQNIAYNGDVTSTIATDPVLTLPKELQNKPKTASDWFGSLGSTPLEKFKAIFKEDAQITEANLEGVYLVQTRPESNNFSIEVVLKDSYFTSTNSNVITFDGFTYISTDNTVTLPVLANDSVIVSASQTDVNAWWQSLQDLPTKIAAINGWFKQGSDLISIASLIDSINLNPVDAASNEYKLEINLLEGKVFSDGSGTATIPVTITYSKSDVTLQTPALKPNIDQTGDEPTLSDWWNGIKNDVTSQVNAISTWFDPNADLINKIKDDIASISLGSDGQDPAKVNLTINLNPGFTFKEGKSVTLHTTVKYAKSATKIGPQPTMTGTTVSVISPDADVNTWWSSFKGVVNNQVDAIKGWFNNDGLTKIKANIASINLVASTSDKTKWDLTINLSSGKAFDDGSKIAEFKGLTISLQPILVTDPKPVNSTIVETGTEKDASVWVDAFNAKQKPDKITYLNEKVFDQNTNLNSFKDHIDKIEFVGTSDKTKYNLTITLIPGYHFSSNHADKLTLPITINFTHQDFVTKPELKPGASATVATTAKNIGDWWSGFNKDVSKEISAINDWFETGKDLSNISSSVQSLDLVQQGKTDKWDLTIQLNKNTFFTGTSKDTTTLTITLTYVSQTEVNKPELNPGATAIVATPVASIDDWWKNFNKDVSKEINAINEWFVNGKDLISIKSSIKSLELVQKTGTNIWGLTINLNDNIFFTGTKESTTTLTITLTYVHQIEVKLPELKPGPKSIDATVSDVKAWWDSFNKDLTKEVNAINPWFNAGKDLRGISSSIKSLDLTASGTGWNLKIQLVDNTFFSIADKKTDAILSVTINYRVIVTDPKLANPQNPQITETGTEANTQAWVDAFNAKQKPDKITYLDNNLFDKSASLSSLTDNINTIEFVANSGKWELTITLNQGFCFSNRSDKLTLPITINFTHQDFVTKPELKPGASATVATTAKSIGDWWSGFNSNKEDQIKAINDWFETGKDLSNISSSIQSLDLVQQGKTDKWDLTIQLIKNTFFTGTKETSVKLSVIITYQIQTKVSAPKVQSEITVNSAQLTVGEWVKAFNGKKTTDQISIVQKWLENGSSWDTFKDHISTITLDWNDSTKSYKLIIGLGDNYVFDDGSGGVTPNVELTINTIHYNVQLNDPELNSQINVTDKITLDKWIEQFNGDTKTALGKASEWFSNWSDFKDHIQSIKFKETSATAINNTLEIVLATGYVFKKDNKPNASLPVRINYKVMVTDPEWNGNPITVNSAEGTPAEWVKTFNSNWSGNIVTVNGWLNPNLDAFKDHISGMNLVAKDDGKYDLTITLKDNYVFNDGSDKKILNIAITYNVLLKDPVLNDKKAIDVTDKGTLESWIQQFNDEKVVNNKLGKINGLITNLSDFQDHIKTISFTKSNATDNTLVIELEKGYVFKKDNKPNASLPVTINFTSQKTVPQPPQLTGKTKIIKIADGHSVMDWWGSMQNNVKMEISQIKELFEDPNYLENIEPSIESLKLEPGTGENVYKLTINLKPGITFAGTDNQSSLPLDVTMTTEAV